MKTAGMRKSTNIEDRRGMQEQMDNEYARMRVNRAFREAGERNSAYDAKFSETVRKKRKKK